jgi:hypothetical protein
MLTAMPIAYSRLVKRKPAPPRSRALATGVRSQVKSYIDRFGWDVGEDEVAWRLYQRRQMEREYGSDEW